MQASGHKTLNPFDIRASFKHVCITEVEQVNGLSIPLISGLHSNQLKPYKDTMAKLSQSLWYQGFIQTGRRYRFGVSRWLSIPLISGLHSNLPLAHRTQTNGPLNPFDIRASFKQLFSRKAKPTRNSQSLWYQGFIQTSLSQLRPKQTALSIPLISGLHSNQRV